MNFAFNPSIILVIFSKEKWVLVHHNIEKRIFGKDDLFMIESFSEGTIIRIKGKGATLFKVAHNPIKKDKK